MSAGAKSGAAHVILLRHAPTAQSADGLFAGMEDYPLSEFGRTMARTWRSVFEQLADPAVFYSPLQRAVQTAELAGLFDGTPISELREWDLGILEGTVANVYRQSHPGWNLFRDGPPASTGETPTQVHERAERVVRQIARDATPGTVSIAVSHGQFIRALAMSLLCLPLSDAGKLSCGPARAAIFTQRSGKYSLTGWNVSPNAEAGGLLKALT